MEFNNPSKLDSSESLNGSKLNETLDKAKDQRLDNPVGDNDVGLIGLVADSDNNPSHFHIADHEGKPRIFTEKETSSMPIVGQLQLFESQSCHLISKRPELYSGLGPWDFLVDSSNISHSVSDDIILKNEESSVRLTKQQLKLTIERLEEIIVKFQNVIKQTCVFDINSSSSILPGKKNNLSYKVHYKTYVIHGLNT